MAARAIAMKANEQRATPARALLAWATCALALVITAIGVGVAVASWSVPAAPGITPRGFPLVLAPPFAVVGALISARAPGNGIGHVFLYIGIAAAIQLLAEQVAYAAGLWPALLPVAPWAAALFVAIGVTSSLLTALYIVALFPAGRFATPTERRAVIVGTIALVALSVLTLLTSEQLPVARWTLATPIIQADMRLAFPLSIAALAFYLLALGVIALSFLGRFRRSQGVERQQFKWFAYAAAVVAGTLVIEWIGVAVGYVTLGPHFFDTPPTEIQVLLAVSIAAYAALPLAIGFAILRYRLYDIDVLINRTLVYGAVSATLAATYAVAVIVLQSVLRPLTGGSEFAVALSTLLVVALFQPIRARAQSAVDRRFYRARYDAARTIDAFSVRLRGDVELDSVRADLIRVVHETIHPAHASLWLRRHGR